MVMSQNQRQGLTQRLLQRTTTPQRPRQGRSVQTFINPCSEVARGLTYRHQRLWIGVVGKEISELVQQVAVVPEQQRHLR